MRIALKISLLLNLGFAGVLVFTFAVRQHPSRHVPAPSPVAAIPHVSPEPIPAAPPVAVRPQPAPFQWSQLTSTDYRTYVKNLRGCGCPETTVRAIVANDVHAVFHKLESELDERLSELDNASWSARLEGFNTEQTVRAQRAALPGMEAEEIENLLGLARAASQDVANVAAIVPAPPVNDVPVALPLVFQNVNVATLNPTPDQLQIINDVRQSFLADIGGANQDPTDPAYLQRWQKALPAADDMLRGMLGGSFFENYQLAAVGN